MPKLLIVYRTTLYAITALAVVLASGCASLSPAQVDAQITKTLQITAATIDAETAAYVVACSQTSYAPTVDDADRQRANWCLLAYDVLAKQHAVYNATNGLVKALADSGSPPTADRPPVNTSPIAP